MKQINYVYFVIALIVLHSCKLPVNPDVSNVSNDKLIQQVLDSMVVQNEIPGLNFSFIDSNKVQHDFSSGLENMAHKTNLTTTHTMFSGSVGKTYAAAIIFQMADEGRIQLDDKVLLHLPKNNWLRRIPNMEDISVRMLLSHTSGLPRWVMKPEVWDILHKEPDKVWSYEDRFAFVFDEAPVHQAGARWTYSDTNYLLLGYLIETLLEKDYYEVLNERIVMPYKLENTYPSLSRSIERLSSGYSSMPTSFQVPSEVVDSIGQYVFNPQFEWTGGGLASTTSDLIKWVDIYYTKDIISKTRREDMFEINDVGRNVYDQIHSYGMGTFIYSTAYGDAYGHSGFMPGYNTIMAYFPKMNMSLAIQINCDYASKKTKLVSYLETCISTIQKTRG